MTTDRPYPLKMRVLEAMIHAENNYVHPDQVQVAIDLIRAEVLEEAARVADDERWNTACLTSLPPQSSAAFNIAAAIRALKGDT